MKKSGFSLVELLAVIAIIVILAALLFPVFQSSQREGKLAASKNNMRQIAVAMQLYADDFNGFIPHTSFQNIEPLFRYTKSKEIFACPIDPYQPRGADAQNSWNSGARISYSFPPIFIRSAFEDYHAAFNPGVVAALHVGEKVPWEFPFNSEHPPSLYYTGTYFVGRRDTSVARIPFRLRCFENPESRQGVPTHWDVFVTDGPDPSQETQMFFGGPWKPCPPGQPDGRRLR